ncbi:hypothetical protein J4219_00795 [Candidatus Woesearchaeota archaeon]|nr:hypothetical protein [Candidatus Woesearchaeota archaeon]
MEKLIPVQFSAADVYAVYAALHPDRIETKNHTVEIDEMGKSFIGSGTNHKVVVDLDYDDFKRFMREFVK